MNTLPPVERPRVREDCQGHEGPCPFVGCAANLYLEVNERTGTITFNFPGREVWEIPCTCALDFADAGEHTLDEVGQAYNLTRERIRQLVEGALLKVRRAMASAAASETGVPAWLQQMLDTQCR